MKKKIDCALLIDDDKVSNYISEKFLREANVTSQIIIASNGENALRYIESCPSEGHPYPELIFLDINMPVMDAFDFLDLYRSIYHNNKGIIIVLTSSSNPKDKEKLARFGIADYINKPLTSEKISKVMEKHFGW